MAKPKPKHEKEQRVEGESYHCPGCEMCKEPERESNPMAEKFLKRGARLHNIVENFELPDAKTKIRGQEAELDFAYRRIAICETNLERARTQATDQMRMISALESELDVAAAKVGFQEAMLASQKERIDQHVNRYEQMMERFSTNLRDLFEAFGWEYVNWAATKKNKTSVHVLRFRRLDDRKRFKTITLIDKEFYAMSPSDRFEYAEHGKKPLNPPF